MTVSAAFVADVDRWWRRVCRVGRRLLPLLLLYSFMHRSILISSSHAYLYDYSPVPTIICGCLPCRSVESRHFHVAFACISVVEIRTAFCTRSSDELTIQHVFWDAPVSHSLERGSSVVECRTRNQVSPGSNPALLLCRRLGIFVLSIDAPVDSAV